MFFTLTIRPVAVFSLRLRAIPNVPAGAAPLEAPSSTEAERYQNVDVPYELIFGEK